MKKLLLFIVPLLLLFGVSFGDTFEYTTPNTPQTSNSYSFHATVFEIVWVSWNSVNFYSFVPNSYWSFTCEKWWLYNFSWSLIKSGAFSAPSTWTQVVDQSLTPWLYTLRMTLSNGNSCSASRKSFSSSSQLFQSGFFRVICGQSDWMTNGCIFVGWDWQIQTYTFSWADPRITTPTPITIRYNWTWMTFAGSNIYLDGLFHNMITSGADAVFQPYVYRALFRSH